MGGLTFGYKLDICIKITPNNVKAYGKNGQIYIYCKPANNNFCFSATCALFWLHESIQNETNSTEIKNLTHDHTTHNYNIHIHNTLKLYSTSIRQTCCAAVYRDGCRKPMWRQNYKQQRGTRLFSTLCMCIISSCCTYI